MSVSIWLLVIGFVMFTTAGDVMLSRAMTLIGDMAAIRRASGIAGVIRRVTTNGTFWIAIVFMAASFFSLLLALNRADLSFVGPASSAMTFVSNTLAAKFFLKERVDCRRWTAAALVCVGILLISK
jgi:multidrug transporter EmrE-like cation transporter